MGKPLTREFLLGRGECCGNKCLNCPYIPKHIKGTKMENKEEEIPTLAQLVDLYEEGKLDTSKRIARKCYMNDLHKYKKIITWVHDDEMKGHSVLRGMSKSNAHRDLLKNKGLL